MARSGRGEALQVALGKLRLASGHFRGKLLAIDPHRVRSHSARRMRERKAKSGERPVKMAHTFWVLDADHLSRDLFHALQADVRVRGNTILVTYYHAPNVEQLRAHYRDLPDKLAAEGIRPEAPWLSDCELDFRFR